MSTSIALRTLRRSLRTHGVLGTLWLLPAKLRGPKPVTPDPFDLQHGVDTSGNVAPEDLTLAPGAEYASQQGVRYQAASPEVFDRLMAHTPIPKEATFIDIGSGEGRAMLLAARWPFREIIGVEYGLELQMKSEVNIARFHAPDQMCLNFRCVWADALTYPLPLTPLVLFLFNPFGRGMVREFRMHVERSMREHPRPILLIYQHPIGADVFEESLAWRVVHRQVEGIVYQVR